LSSVYLIRHGQAGTRELYDALSDTGHEQARLLGEYLAAQGLRFSAVISGGLRRQRETAEQLAIAFRKAGLELPELTMDAQWNEFDLDSVYRGFSPFLCEEDPKFRREYEHMQAAIAASAGSPHAEITRRSNDCDKTVVTAWVEGRHPFDGESWVDFKKRINGCLQSVSHLTAGENAIVFTSATPIGILSASTLGVQDGRALYMAGVLQNSSISSLRVRGSEVRLFSFNGVPHLTDPAMRTFR
jgi:broad specificity phosphatase PhoE